MNEKKIVVKCDKLNVNFPVKSGLPFAPKKYIQAVTDVSLEIYQGETFGIVGESGCGKSTLANAIVGMVKPTSGTVLFKDKDLYSLKRHEFKETRRSGLAAPVFISPFLR